MTDDKANASQEQAQLIEVGIQTDAVTMMVCPGCGVEIDTEGIPSFTEIACPHCKTRQTVSAKLGNFRLLSVIGAGGMGAVFMAQDDTLNRRVAIKVMLRSIGSDPKVLETFRREAQSAARLNNPHIVQIYSFGEEKGQPYLVMELVSGDKLDEMIEAGEPLDPAFVIRVGLEIADGLATAQAANLVHGDIKPENILFDEKMQAKLVDFGIASMLSSKDAGKEIWGTPYYIAPEKAQRRKTDIRSDIYSLGATLYHAIAGRPPFDGDDPVKVIRARFEGPAAPLSEVRPGTDAQASAIVERMIQNDLFLRYPNYNSLIKDMRKYLDSVPEVRKTGPQSRKIRLRKSATQSNLGLNGSTKLGLGMTTSSGELKTGSGLLPAAPGGGGRKSFVIQKGTMSAAASASPTIARAPGVAATGAFSATEEAGGLQEVTEDPPKPKRPPISPKTVALLILSLFGALLIVAVAVVVGVVMNNRAQEKAMDQKFLQVQAWDEEWAGLGPVLTESVTTLGLRDAEAGKILESVGATIQKALAVPWIVPDLEPPKTAEPVEEDGEEVTDSPKGDGEGAAPTGEATKENGEEIAESPDTAKGDGEESAPANQAVPETAGDGAIEPEGVAEPAEEASPDFVFGDELPPAEDRPPLVRRAEALWGPARQIRARLRQAEALRDRAPPPLAAVRREAMSEGVWAARQQHIQRRTQELEAVREWIGECDALLLSMRRMIPELDKEASSLLEEARKREEAERLARETEAAEQARRREQAEREAKVRAEIGYVETLVSQRRAIIEKYDYARVSRELRRVRQDLVTEGGLAALDAAVDRYARLESLKEFIVRDLHEYQGLRWGLSQVDIVDADKQDGIALVNGKKVPLETLTIPQWIHLVVQLLEIRPADRRIRVIEHGEQLFNAAIFCIVHGGGSETSRTKAATLTKMALQRRTALRPDVARLLPEIAESASAD